MSDIDSILAAHLQPGDHVVWGQGCGEPLALTKAIVRNRHDLRLGGAFVGAVFSETLTVGAVDGLPLTSYGTLGNTRPLADTGLLTIVPCHVSRLSRAIRRGEIPCDVALVQLSPIGPNGKHSMGLSDDYIRAAMERAKTIIVEINELTPWTFGNPPPDISRAAAVLHTSYPPTELKSKPPTDVENAIGAHIASIVPDRATLQLGIGGTIDAMLTRLTDHRDLGIHSGAIGDGVFGLIESGAVNNSHKPIDKGKTVTAGLFGTNRLFDYANENDALALRPYDYTHASSTLARINNLVAINGAIEVDLTGQVNAEVANGRYLGAVGGQVDFMHAATRAELGCSIIALPSTAAKGTTSRIRKTISTVTCARSEVDFVVTEFGVADLRCCNLDARRARILAISHPSFRDDLETR